MKKCTLCVILLLTLPASATITNVQSNANWSCSGSGSSITCKVTTTAMTTTHNLIAVWTFWQSASMYTAAVSDQAGNGVNGFFPSAVGPTLQTAASTPTSAQIFYASNIAGRSPSDQVTVTFTGPTTGSISSAGVVAVEYSGLDQNYPLDSVSAGYSYSAGSTLDSGTAAPANANLLVFGGGTIDAGSVVAGSGFANIQSHLGSISEQMIVSGNNTLQRATAGLASGGPGNWVMQMAVFRDASWTVGGGWSPARQGNILYADQFPSLQAAISALPASGGTVIVPPLYSDIETTELDIGTPGTPGTPRKTVTLRCGPGATIISNLNDSSGISYGVRIAAGSHITGESIGIGGIGCKIQAGPAFKGKALFGNNPPPPPPPPPPPNYGYFSVEKVVFDCGGIGPTFASGSCVDVDTVFEPSFMRDVTIGDFGSSASVVHGLLVHASTSQLLDVFDLDNVQVDAENLAGSQACYLGPIGADTAAVQSVVGIRLYCEHSAIGQHDVIIEGGTSNSTAAIHLFGGQVEQYSTGGQTADAIYIHNCKTCVIEGEHVRMQGGTGYAIQLATSGQLDNISIIGLTSFSAGPSYLCVNDVASGTQTTSTSAGCANYHYNILSSGPVVYTGFVDTRGITSVGIQSVTGCTLGSPLGGSMAGSFISGASSCSITITPGITAPNGFSCTASDLTHPADSLKQATYTTTAATMSGTVASGDLISWSCVAF